MDPARTYWHPVLGYNFRMTNLQAAIGLGQMEHVEQLLRDRRQIARLGIARACNTKRHSPCPWRARRVTNVFWLYSVLVDGSARRDLLREELAAADIETRPFFYPVPHVSHVPKRAHGRGLPKWRPTSRPAASLCRRRLI